MMLGDRLGIIVLVSPPTTAIKCMQFPTMIGVCCNDSIVEESL